MDAATDILINAGLVAGLVEAIKRGLGARFDSERFGPLLAILVGVLTAVGGVFGGWYASDLELGGAILVGIIAGLTAAGIYRTTQSAARTTPGGGSS